MVQEREAAESGWRPAENAFASRRTLLLEGRPNKFIIYPPAEHFDVVGSVVEQRTGWDVFIAKKGKKFKQYQF